jgi:hypothetical protein
MGAAGGGAILLLVLAVFGLRRLRGRPAPSVAVLAALPPGLESAPVPIDGDSTQNKMQAQLSGQADAQARLEAEALNAIQSPTPTTNKKEVLTKYLQAGLKKDPMVQVQTLRTWLNEKA